MSRVLRKEWLETSLDAREIVKRCERIRFVSLIRVNGSEPILRYLKRRSPDHGFWCIGHEQVADDLDVICTINTRHYPFRDRFNPTVEEYLAQIPGEIVEKVDAIEFYPEGAILGDTCWESTSRLFRLKEKAACC